MSKYLISLILLSVISMGVSAQRITRQYNNVSFSAALKDLNAKQDKYVINFVYDELEDFKVTKNIKNESVPDAIMNLIGFYPIKMKQVDNIIIVECIQKTSNRMMGRIVDTHHQPVDFANVALLNVSDSSLITGGVTNENGQFVIPCEVKKAIVKVSCVGYKTYCNFRVVTPFFYQREVCTAHNKPWGRIRCRNKECHKHHYRTPFLGWTFWYCGCGNLQT